VRYLIRIFSLVLGCFYLSTTFADTVSAELINLLNNVRTMQGEFIQTISNNKGKAISQTNGLMALQRPGKFRWDTKQPNKQLIVTNGTKVWIYDPDLDQVTIRFLTKEAGETPALLLSNTNSTLEKDFSVEVLNIKSPLRWFLLKPKDRGSMFEAIKLGFDNQQIKQMQLQDHLGHVTHIQFSHVVINKVLASSLFTFTPPAKVDVIDETHR
jgi:outer membrane lipoprotein carrier protein